MPARVAAIKAAIETRQDFTGLANGGEDAVARWAKSHGMNGRQLILGWQQTYRQRQAHVERGHKKPSNTDSNERVSKRDVAAMHDLDYWSDSEPEPDDDGDVTPCPACNGRGKDAAGNRCEACEGSGKVSPNDDEEDDDGEFKED